MPVPAPPLTVQIDLYIARRKRVHAVVNSAAETLFHDPYIIRVMDWLADQDINRVRFADEEHAFIVNFQRAHVD